MPETSALILSQLNTDCKDFDYNSSISYELGTPSPLFMRIDVSKE